MITVEQVNNIVEVNEINNTITIQSVGVQGVKGDTGATGAAGTNGADGQAATIAVGTTTTLSAGSSATVTNVGTSNAAVFNFGIPKGADGSGGGGGSFNKIVAEVDFGVTANGLAIKTIAAVWANSTSVIICAPYATTTDDHDPEDYALEGLTAYVTNIVDGVGFDIIASCNNTTFGKYNIQAIGV